MQELIDAREKMKSEMMGEPAIVLKKEDVLVTKDTKVMVMPADKFIEIAQQFIENSKNA